MRFADFVVAVEATILTDYGIEMRRCHSGDGRVEWKTSIMTLLLEIDTRQSVALSAQVDNLAMRRMPYSMEFRSVRGLARDIATLMDVPGTARM